MILNMVREKEQRNMDNYIVHFCKKIKEVGIKNTLIGLWRREKLGRICSKYGLHPWLKSPYELRLYAQMAAESVNELAGIDCVVEVGCGLGEIIRHINVPKKYGYDIDSHVIEVAKAITPRESNIEYFVGELRDVDVSNADVLLTIGWMHAVSYDDLKTAYHECIEKNKFRYVVVDVKIMEDRKRDFSVFHPVMNVFQGRNTLLWNQRFG